MTEVAEFLADDQAKTPRLEVQDEDLTDLSLFATEGEEVRHVRANCDLV